MLLCFLKLSGFVAVGMKHLQIEKSEWFHCTPVTSGCYRELCKKQGWHSDSVLTWNFIISLFLATDGGSLTTLGFPAPWEQAPALLPHWGKLQRGWGQGLAAWRGDRWEGTREPQGEPLTSLRLSSLKFFITFHFFKIKPSLWRGRSFDLYGLSRSVPIYIISPKIRFSIADAYH